MKKEFKWWMSLHLALWGVTSPKRVKFYHYNISMGFPEYSSYWSTRCASKELIKYIFKYVKPKNKEKLDWKFYDYMYNFQTR